MLQRVYGLALTFVLSISTAALADPRDLVWTDLIPAGTGQSPLERRSGDVAFGEVTHFDVTGAGPVETRLAWRPPDPAIADAVQPPASGYRSDLDGVEVRIAGFITPLAFEGERITEFLLVPYFGACLHVPAPAANQIIHVTDAEGVLPGNLFDPVYVTGTLSATVTKAEFGEIGYAIAGGRFEPAG